MEELKIRTWLKCEVCECAWFTDHFETSFPGCPECGSGDFEILDETEIPNQANALEPSHKAAQAK